MLELEVKSLRTILDLEGAWGLTIPYLGHMETRQGSIGQSFT